MQKGETACLNMWADTLPTGTAEYAPAVWPRDAVLHANEAERVQNRSFDSVGIPPSNTVPALAKQNKKRDKAAESKPKYRRRDTPNSIFIESAGKLCWIRKTVCTISRTSRHSKLFYLAPFALALYNFLNLDFQHIS